MTTRKGKVLVRSGKGRKRREVPLNADARKALRGLDHTSSSTAIFRGQRGHITPRGVQGMLGKYAKAARLEDGPAL